MAVEVIPIAMIGVVIIIAIALSIIVKKLGQNPVLGFIIAGFVLGPFGIRFLNPTDPLVIAFSELGLFVLLFYLGLELSLKDFLRAGSSGFGLAIVDMIVLTGIGILIMTMLGFSVIFAIAVGFMLFSTSTAVVAKFCIDRNLMKTASAQLAVSILIMQDFIGIMLLVMITSMHSGGSAFGLALTAVVFAVSAFFGVHQLSKQVEKWFIANKFGHTEITLYALGVGFVVATLASMIGLSVALGAYFAGFALAETRAGTRIKKDVGFMRDFFLLFFFVGFGTTLFFDPVATVQALPELSAILFYAAIAVVLTVCLVIINFFVFGLLGNFFGLNRDDSSIAAVLLTPLGEFVVIIATTVMVVLPAVEKTLIAPIAFMLILVSVVVFQPLHNLLPLHQKLIAKLPVLFKRKIKKSVLPPHTAYSMKQLQLIAINGVVLLCFALMTLILYNELPRFGIPILYSRQITASLIFLAFAFFPAYRLLRAVKNLLTFSHRFLKKHEFKDLFKN